MTDLNSAVTKKNRHVPGKWTDVCGFIKPPNTDIEWQVGGHGAFENKP